MKKIMNECICGGIYGFCNDFKSGLIPKYIKEFKCPCGCYLYIVDDTVWYNLSPLDSSKIK